VGFKKEGFKRRVLRGSLKRRGFRREP